MKRLTKRECLTCMQRSTSGTFCFYKDKYFQQMVEDGDTQWWKDCDVSDKERLRADMSSIRVGDIVYMTGTKREVEILEVNPPHSLLVKPTDGKVFYRRNDGVDIMQAWFGYERILKKKEEKK